MSLARPLRLLLGVWLLAIATLAGAQDFPGLSGRVVDAAEILPEADEAALTTKLEEVETETGRQFVIATVPDLQGYDIADYGYRLGRHWGIGDAERDDGVLLIVAPNEREVRIEVGYGLEGELTDAWSSFIINTDIIPRFKNGDLPGGIEAGADGIIRRIAPDQAVPFVRANPPRVEKSGPDLGDLTFVVVMFVLLFGLPFAVIVIPILIMKKYYPERYKKWQANAAKRRSSGIRDGGSSRSFSSGSRSFSSSRSFSGGGGSFGGGGASGRW